MENKLLSDMDLVELFCMDCDKSLDCKAKAEGCEGLEFAEIAIKKQDILSRKMLFEEMDRNHILVKLDGYTEYTKGYYVAIPETKWKAIENSLSNETK